MNKIMFCITYADSTPESDEMGEFEDSDVFDETFCPEFSELVDYLKRAGFSYWSSSEPSPSHDWLSTESYVTDYASDRERMLSIHAKDARSWRYLKKAADMIGIKA